MSDVLFQLADAHGIELAYDDIWGNAHRASTETLRAVLRAMGVRADSDNDAAAELSALEDARWRARLAPLCVLRSGRRPWRIRLQLPADVDCGGLRYRIHAEDGGTREGAVVRIGDALGRRDIADEPWLAHEIAFDPALAPGYHALELLQHGGTVARTVCAVTPPACYRPPALRAGRRAFGAAVQLYGLRSKSNWGIGDFTDLAEAARQWGDAGASVVGLNPLHALFPHDPAHASPYSPSSRLFVNVLYLDVTAVAEFADCRPARDRVGSPAFQAELEALRAAPLVDYPRVAAAKMAVLEMLHAHFRARGDAEGTRRRRQFRAFRKERGDALQRHAVFEALQEHLHAAASSVWGWPAWPQPYRDPGSPAVARFAVEHADRVDFFAWLQWQADLQRRAAARSAVEAGLALGLYTDLAVSVDRGGAEAWANQHLFATHASVGAPPDAFNMKGQDWGLPPLIPHRLHAAGYRPYLATLRANMRHAGALRIDHVMGLRRLFWVPPGAAPAEGAYVRYPFDDLLALLALESHRHRCLVIGEDLGTVTDEVREGLAACDVLSYRVLLFEKDERGFKSPASYPEAALATASTHDLPTLGGWWDGHDLHVRAEHALIPSPDEVQRQLAQRADDRQQLLAALRDAGVLRQSVPGDWTTSPMTTELTQAVQAFLATTPSALMIVQLEDVFGVREQANLPGTVAGHPNWRRKLPVTLEEAGGSDRFRLLTARLAGLRPRRGSTRSGKDKEIRSTAKPTGRPRRQRHMPQGAVPLPPSAIPRATYRLQLHRGFTFADATALVPYLAALGVSHLYCSPYLRARPGSTHGYDVVDHCAFNPEIGTAEDFERLVATLAHHGMSHICDVVPNHMAVMGQDNAWWMDVLENGQASEYAKFFDIDWTPPDPDLAGRVLVPVLGDPYGVVLERGDLRLEFEGESGTIAARYFEHRFPLDPRETAPIIALASSLARESADAGTANALSRLSQRLAALPRRADPSPDAVALRRSECAACKAELAARYRDQPALRAAIAQAVTRHNGSPDSPGSFETLHRVLEAQAFRLAHWRVAGDEINYRRFFDVNHLAALRMEDPDVFAATHDFLLGLAAQGKIGGLRIDHPDGLFDPARYFERLQQRYRALAAERGAPEQEGVYVVLEKILAPHERIPASWPVHGDTGYPFANTVTAVLADPTARGRMTRVWRALLGEEARDFETTSYESKRAIMRSTLASGLTTLASHALRIARADHRTRDFTFSTLRAAIAETVAWFPVYRTYVADAGPSAQDRRYIEWAVARGRQLMRAADPSIFDFVRALLLAEPPADVKETMGDRYRDFAMRFQQYTAPVAAKGVEDTAFYRHTRFVALNDVGGDPSMFGITRRAFHRITAQRASNSPFTLLATSTHDNKRSEDVRMRLDVISEMPAAWRLAVRRWSRMNRTRKLTIHDRPAPSRSDEYLLYQTLAGSYPAEDVPTEEAAAYRDRIEQYMVKSAREAKLRTSWVSVDADYERALTEFVAALLEDRPDNRFLADLRAQRGTIAWFGMLNSLSMTLLKLTSPGVPDIYQGAELLDLSLVDPDNRRTVDYASRQALLASLAALAEAATGEVLAERVRALFASPYDGRAKLWIVQRALAFRKENREIFDAGDYLPLAATGARTRHVVAFARRHAGSGIVVVAGRLFASLGLEPGVVPLGDQVWADTKVEAGFLAPGTVLSNVLTGESLVIDGTPLRLAALFSRYPAAMLAYSAPG